MLTKIFESKKKKELRKKRREFYLQFLSSGDIYYDIGANYGNRIEPIIDENIKIIAIEPQPKCIKKLKSKFKNNIILIPKGLGAKKDVMTMFLARAHTISTFSKDFIKATQESGRFSKYKWDKQISVEIDTLDNVISQHGKPSFMKIDVEGFELEVLKGLSSPIKFISCEYTVPERKDSLISCIDRIVEISGEENVVFNYSIGESMEWALENWLTLKEMKKEINTDKFIKTDFGDIYSKMI
jgi:FkbM family methyltransferase